MVIRQGDVFWVELPAPSGSEPGYARPVLVVQNDLFNSSRIGTVVVCALTTNLALARAPGNVQLEEGEAGLPKQSVVNISQVATLDRSLLAGKIGSLTRRRLGEVLDGLALLFMPVEADDA